MKKSKLVLLIVFLLLLAVAVWLLLTSSKEEKTRPIFTADSTAVHRIEIASPDASISFEKQDGGWRIIQPVDWAVDEGHFQLFLREVIQERYSTESIASGPKALEQYHLTKDKALRIKAFDARNKLLREAWFGDPGNFFDYFRFAGDSEVYQIKRKVNSFYGPKLESWRSPYLFGIFPDQMLSIRVRHTKNSYELTRDGNIWHYKDRLEDFEVPPGNEVMGRLLNAMSSLRSNTMLSGNTLPPEGSVPEPECEVEVMLTDNSTLSFSFHPWEDDTYLLKIDRHPNSYFVVIYDTVQRFIRHAGLFRAVQGDPAMQ